MPQTIHKFPVLSTPGRWTVTMPVGAKILSVQVQGYDPQMWALVDRRGTTQTEIREFATYGTGHLLPDDPGEFVGTFQRAGGGQVFHLFETN